MFEVLDFPESNDKNQLQQLTKSAGPRIPQQHPANNAFPTAPARAQIGWLDSSNSYNALPTSQQERAEKVHERAWESRRLPGPKRLDGPRTQHQFLTEPQSTSAAAGSRLVDDFDSSKREHKQSTYYHRHQRPRANIGTPRYRSPPCSRRNYADRPCDYSNRDKVYSPMEGLHNYCDTPETEDYRCERGWQKIPRPRGNLRSDPEPHLQSQPTRTKEPRRDGNHVIARAITQEMQRRKELQERLKGKLRKEGAAMKRAAVGQYKLEQKHQQRQEEERRRRKLEKLEREFREKVQAELDNLMEHVQGLVLAHDKVEIDEAVDAVHADEVSPTELSTRRTVRKGFKTEVQEKKTLPRELQIK